MVGRIVSHYTILEKLGEGGMGVVYKAEDTRLHRTVALKFLPADLTRDPIAERRFLLEAQAASALDHPNICPVFEFAETEQGELYMVMPCYEGATLRTMIDRGPLTPGHASDIARQAAAGLAEAHKHGIIHRDINPSNIVVTREGVVKILDFGLAILAGRTRVTAPGRAVGTLAYIPPEAIAGKDLDERADVWALGVTLFEMLTGRLPFRGEYPAELIYSIANELALDAGEFRPDLPESLRRTCSQCLQKDRSARFQSMEEVSAYLRGAPPPARGAPGRARASRTVRTLAAAGVTLGLLATLWFQSRHEQQSPSPVTRTRVAILPFRNPGGDSALSLLSRDGQALLAAEFIGVEWLGIVDPLSLNGIMESSLGSITPDRGTEFYRVIRGKTVSFVIDPSLSRAKSGYRLHTNVIDASKDPSELVFASEQGAGGEADIHAAIDSLAGRILDFLEVRVFHENQDRDIRPWLAHRKSSTSALKAFSQAWEWMYRADYDEAGRYLRLAIQLDSMFVSPRVWLIPDLLQAGRAGEAEEHYRFLQRMEMQVNPFERTMIAWSAAYLQHDFARQAACLEEALEYSPENNILLGNLGYDRYRLNDFEGALKALAPCLESRWRYPPMYPLAAICYIKAGRSKDARSTLEQSLSHAHIDPRTFSLLSALSVQEGDSAASTRYADQFMKRSLERGDSLSKAFALLGDHSFMVGSFGRAAEWFGKAVHGAPHVPMYREKLEEALYRMYLMSDPTNADTVAIRQRAHALSRQKG
jgi:serine/threonine protein kinase/tetratricopeptide (TPR) repeat protein